MPMELFVLRHGPAADHAFDGGDAHRPLTPEGRARVAVVARVLAEEGPFTVLASPYVRALSTAEIVAAACGVTHLETRKALVPGGPFEEVLDELASPLLPADARVLLVSHEPTVSSLVERLAGRPLRDGCGLASAIAFEFKANEQTRWRANYRWYLDGRTATRTFGREIFS